MLASESLPPAAVLVDAVSAAMALDEVSVAPTACSDRRSPLQAKTRTSSDAAAAGRGGPLPRRLPNPTPESPS